MGKIALNRENRNLRKACKYYPCHQEISDNDYDCRLCYCPFYQLCTEEAMKGRLRFGGELLPRGMLSCMNCTTFHHKAVADRVLDLQKTLSIEQVFKILHSDDETVDSGVE